MSLVNSVFPRHGPCFSTSSEGPPNCHPISRPETTSKRFAIISGSRDRQNDTVSPCQPRSLTLSNDTTFCNVLLVHLIHVTCTIHSLWNAMYLSIPAHYPHACFKLTIGMGLFENKILRLTMVITSYRIEDVPPNSSPRARTANGFGNETSLPSRW